MCDKIYWYLQLPQCRGKGPRPFDPHGKQKQNKEEDLGRCGFAKALVEKQAGERTRSAAEEKER